MVTSDDFWEAAVRREVERVRGIVKIEALTSCTKVDSKVSSTPKAGEISDSKSAACDLSSTLATPTPTADHAMAFELLLVCHYWTRNDFRLP